MLPNWSKWRWDRNIFLKSLYICPKYCSEKLPQTFSRYKTARRSWKKTFEKNRTFFHEKISVRKKICWWKSRVFGGFWVSHIVKKMKFGAKTHSKGTLNLSVGAQTLWSCSTHQFYNFWKFHQKILIFSEVINDFRFRPQSRFMPLSSADKKAVIEDDIENHR